MKDRDDVLLVVMGGRVIGNVIARGDGGRLLYDRDVEVPLSLSMPSTKLRHRSEVLTPWLRNLLPDNGSVLLQWRRTFGVKSANPIELLKHIGEEVAGGAQFIRPERLPDATIWKPAQPVRDADIGDMLRRAMAAMPEVDPASGTGRFSLAGAQPKIAMQRLDNGVWGRPEGINPTTHILKPALPGLQDQHVNEHLTMTAAGLVGMSVAHTDVATIDGIPVVIVERYDRIRSGDRWERAHQEDLLQALGLPPERRYQNDGGPDARRIASTLGRVTRDDASVRDFVARLVFHWLTVSTDAHAKNYSLLLDARGARLAPMYDLNSFLFYGDGTPREMSMSIGGEFRSDRITWSDWATLARDTGVSQDWLATEIRRQATALPDAFADAAQNSKIKRGLPRRLVKHVERWTRAALAQVSLG